MYLDPVTTQSASTSIKQQKYGEKANDVQRIKIGEKFGDLTVLHKVAGEKKTTFRCRCKCGVKKPILRASLVSGNTESCGCKHRTELAARNYVHGLAKRGTKIPVELRIFYDAKARCRCVTNRSYNYYGGRGIRFRFHSFAEFMSALKTKANPSGLRPSKAYSLDRIDNDGHYEKGNVRWSTKSVQMRNRRKWAKKLAA